MPYLLKSISTPSQLICDCHMYYFYCALPVLTRSTAPTLRGLEFTTITPFILQFYIQHTTQLAQNFPPFPKSYLNHQCLKFQCQIINLMCSSKAVAQERSYAELPPEIGTTLILVRKALPKSQKHLCQRRSREVIHKLTLEPWFPGVAHNLHSVPPSVDSFPKNSSFAFAECQSQR